MPELPEVEALAGFLREHAVGAVIGRIDIAALSVLKTFDPPITELQGKDAAAQKQVLESKKKRRRELNRQILDISKKRDAYLRDAEKAAGAEDAFDNKVMDNVAEQAAGIGVTY